MKERRADELFAPERLLAFSDGVFAVAITLLVIDLHLPAADGGRDEDALAAALQATWPKLVLFAFTFFIIGLSWITHHRKFTLIRVVDQRMLWLNLLYLLALCLVPFVTGVQSDHPGRLSTILYGATMALLYLISAATSAHGLQPQFLKGPPLTRPVLASFILAPIAAALVFAASALLAYGYQVDVARWVLLLLIPTALYAGSWRRT